MSTLAVKFDDHAIDVSFTKTSLHLVLADGREISAPLEWFPRLRDANAADRNKWRFIGNGIGVHWPSIDEDIAVSTLMRGND
ncbi:MAG: hypothetical protein A3F10_07535 [Coxiella sp. RIFCSPHIGHO2_12_FULL_42_15]|nr:MAG: hypothetical protein A3F10_07535 [Coxiella sp. RIFCSPHIGHO2_12_FULL_42_15]